MTKEKVKKKKKTTGSKDNAYWEKELNAIVETHFKQAEMRIPDFIRKELKSAGRVFGRNFRYTAVDFLLLIYNLTGRALNFIFRKKIFTLKESLTESSVRKRFDELVFHSEELDQKIHQYFTKLDAFVRETIKEKVAKIQDGRIEPKTYKSILAAAINQTTTLPDITKLIIVESAIPIFCSHYFAHKITKGFGPVGVIAAQTYYKNQIAWYAKPLYWNLLGFQVKQIPGYIPFLGSILGFTAGLIFIAPFFNSFIEILFSFLINPQKRIARQLRESKKQLLFAGKRKGRGGASKIVFERLNMIGEVLDYVKDMYLAVR